MRIYLSLTFDTKFFLCIYRETHFLFFSFIIYIYLFIYVEQLNITHSSNIYIYFFFRKILDTYI